MFIYNLFINFRSYLTSCGWKKYKWYDHVVQPRGHFSCMFVVHGYAHVIYHHACTPGVLSSYACLSLYALSWSRQRCSDCLRRSSAARPDADPAMTCPRRSSRSNARPRALATPTKAYSLFLTAVRALSRLGEPRASRCSIAPALDMMATNWCKSGEPSP